MRFVLAADFSLPMRIVSWGHSDRDSRPREVFLRRVGLLLPEAAQTIAVLDRRDYRILQLEAPNVPTEEIRSAIRWKAAEYLDGSPHDYTFDVLPLSSTATSSGRASQLIAVAAPNVLLRSRMLECSELKHPLSVIDVGETSLRNLLQASLRATEENVRVAAALSSEGGRALMVIAVDGEIRFFRRFEFDPDMLATSDHDINSALIAHGAVAESVSRSLDQLQRALALWDDANQAEPVQVLLVDVGSKSLALSARLRSELGIDVRPLPLDKLFVTNSVGSTPPWTDPAYTPLLGALLRAGKSAGQPASGGSRVLGKSI